MTTFDKGPSAKLTKIFDAVPDFSKWKSDLWFDWGPVFYRGRLDGSAKVLVIASDPGPTERIAGRTLVGDAGQRVQGFLDKLGLTKSYTCLNASPYAIVPSSAAHPVNPLPIVDDPAVVAWRNQLFSAVCTAKLRAVVAFGTNAHHAVDGWTVPAGVPVHKVRHPSAPGDAATLAEWAPAVTALRAVVTKDTGGSASGPNYSLTGFVPGDWKRIPAADLPFGVPAWLGDDAKNRAKTPAQFNCCWRDPTDTMRRMVWEVGG